MLVLVKLALLALQGVFNDLVELVALFRKPSDKDDEVNFDCLRSA